MRRLKVICAGTVVGNTREKRTDTERCGLPLDPFQLIGIISRNVIPGRRNKF